MESQVVPPTEDPAPTLSPMDPIREAHRQWVAHGWDEAADGMALVTSVVRVHQLLMERVDAALRPHGLTFARYEVLRLLAFTRTGSMSMARLGSLLQVHPTSVTSAVERLERQQYVARTRSERDRRVVLASLTDTGRAVVEAATDSLNSSVFAERWSEDLDTLTSLLGGVRRQAGDAVD